MDVKTIFVLFTLIFSLIMVEATKVHIQATGSVSDDGEPHIGVGVFVVSAGKDGELMGNEDPLEEEYVSSFNNNVPAAVPDSGDLIIPVPVADIEKLGRRLLVAAVESNSSAAPGY
nr:uncharacterized protein LOC109193912 isoform X2 [Ipomoea batatas]GME11815.1 uncharacterized protein LOC109193912 isoform X2 [Ipomoea batatas]